MSVRDVVTDFIIHIYIYMLCAQCTHTSDLIYSYSEVTKDEKE